MPYPGSCAGRVSPPFGTQRAGRIVWSRGFCKILFTRATYYSKRPTRQREYPLLRNITMGRCPDIWLPITMNRLSPEKKHRQYGSCMNTADRSSVRRIWRFIKADTHLAAKLSAENAAAPLSGRNFTLESLTSRFNGAAVSILRIFQNVVRNLSGRTASNKPLSPCGTGLWVIMKKSCFLCWKF